MGEKTKLSMKEAQSYTGLSRSTLERAMKGGRLTPFRPEGVRRVLLERGELDRLLGCAAPKAAG